MKKVVALLLLCTLLIGAFGTSAQDTVELTIATVNNPDMVVMEGFSDVFEAAYPNISLNWVILPENELRSTLTTDAATGSSTFDIVTVGLFDTPIWAANGWLYSIDGLAAQYPDNVQADYNFDDLLPGIKLGLSYEDELYAVPFYGESSMLFYNTRLFEEAGLEMPEQPTWDEVREFACALHDPDNGQYGIALRGLPGWGEIMAPLTTVVNTYGGRWFDENWEPQLTSPEWNEAVSFYVNLINDCGQPGATGTGFTEALTLIAQGQAAMWVDATVAAGFLSNPEQSQIVGELGFAPAPVGPVAKGNHWLWSWNLGIPSTTQHAAEALQFVTWATSVDYINLVGETNGWQTIPPGTRISTYENQAYLDAAPFAPVVLGLMETADPTDSTRDPVPYVGVQFAGIPEFQGIGTDVSQFIAEALAGDITVEEALQRGNEIAREAMEEAGYYDN
ncbi:MAG: sugar ABC transporter substrate-binding protein [Anaerolineae bacterium]|nr:sugar ABC transporter substrate-binding protein [Anaerolineae bacterium]MCA9891664.1 sugar ABC transporter substrate-binding protein [Anaerolineae bacterium]